VIVAIFYKLQYLAPTFYKLKVQNHIDSKIYVDVEQPLKKAHGFCQHSAKNQDIFKNDMMQLGIMQNLIVKFRRRERNTFLST
jgi:3-mercaptopyruvate sulfurtransferase SseA